MLLELSGIAKRFGGLEVIRRMDFGVETGEIVGLIGPNGAGKTTIFNLVMGVHRPDSGRIAFAMPRQRLPVSGKDTLAFAGGRRRRVPAPAQRVWRDRSQMAWSAAQSPT